MTVAAAPREDVAAELAATVLATWKTVGGVLATHPPQVGHIDLQARSGFAAGATGWHKVLDPITDDLIALAPAAQIPADTYSSDLRDRIDVAAAAGLDLAMDLQLSKGIHPDVAWARAVAGYGLDPAGMRAYIQAATRVDKDGSMPLLSVSKKVAQQALLTAAEKIGDTEAAAFATLPAPAVAKAFDPNQLRDPDGEWTVSPAGQTKPKVKVKLRVKERAVVDDNVDALLNSEPVEPSAEVPEPSKFAAATPSKFASSQFAPRASKFASAAPSKFAAAAPAPGPATRSRFAGAGSRFAAATPEQQQIMLNRQVFLMGPPPGRTPPEPVPKKRSADGGTFLPMEDVVEFFFDHNSGPDGDLTRYQTVNFEHIGDYYDEVRGRPTRIQTRWARTAWDTVDGMDVDDDVWSDILQIAVPLWKEVNMDPRDAMSQLGPDDFSVIARNLGIPPSWSEGRDVKELVAQQIEMQENDLESMKNKDGVVVYYDEGIIGAVADYVVWHAPGVINDDGAAFADELEQRIGWQRVEQTPTPTVFTFMHGMNPDEDTSDMRGNYTILHTDYQSAIGIYNYSAPTGKIGLRQIYLKPDGRLAIES